MVKLVSLSTRPRFFVEYQKFAFIAHKFAATEANGEGFRVSGGLGTGFISTGVVFYLGWNQERNVNECSEVDTLICTIDQAITIE